MPIDSLASDSVAVHLAREVLLHQCDQIGEYLTSSGWTVWARDALLFTLLAGFLSYVVNVKKSGGKGKDVSFVPIIAMSFSLILFILDWHQRNLGERMKVLRARVYDALLANPALDLGHLEKAVRDTIPDPSCAYWCMTFNAGLDGWLIYGLAWFVVIGGFFYLRKKT